MRSGGTAHDPLVWLPFPPGTLTGLPPGLRYETWDGTGEFPSDPAEVRFYVPPPVTDEEVVCRPLPLMKRLEVLHPLSSGVDQYLPYLRSLPRDVRLCNSQGVHSAATAELALTLVLSSLRGMRDFHERQRSHAWQSHVSSTLVGKSVLIVGYGSIGSALERLLAPFGCDITRVARRPRRTARGVPVHGPDELASLMAAADVVVLTLPLTASTRGLVDGGLLSAMKEGGLLVNVARGEVVDTDALVKHLENGHISAALDVTDPEPLPAGHPLWSAPGVVITPHAGAFTSNFRPALAAFLTEQVTAYARGLPLRNTLDLSDLG